MANETKIITGKVRASYANVWVPKAMAEGATPKYSVSLLISKKDAKTLGLVKNAIKAALEEGKASKFGGTIPRAYKNPLRDGDTEREDETYAGHYFINASSNNQPGIIDADKNEILDKKEFYSGCFCRASLNFYAFNTNGNKGIAVGLNNLQKLADGENLGGTPAPAAEDFKDAFEDDELY